MKEGIYSFVAPFGAGVLGAGLADIAQQSHLIGAVVGGVFGLLSVIARGIFRLLELRAQHRHQGYELRASRYRKRLQRAGIDPDTED